MEGMWSPVLQQGCVFAISPKNYRQLFARECNVLLLAKLKNVQCLAKFFSQHNVTQVCLFQSTFQKDANYREGRVPIFILQLRPCCVTIKLHNILYC